MTTKEKSAQFAVGDHVEYYRRGSCYPSTIREDLGILRGAGRRYRITSRDEERALVHFAFEVAERYLVKDEYV